MAETSLFEEMCEEAVEASTDTEFRRQSARVPLKLEGETRVLRSRLPVEEAAVASVYAALSGACALSSARGAPSSEVSIDREHLGIAFRSERFFEVNGRPKGWGPSPLSAFWQTSDGWLRTHAHYPWHKAALLEALDARSDEPDRVSSAMSSLRASEMEERIFARGGVATAMRPEEEWAEHPQGSSLADMDLVLHETEPGAPPRRRDPSDLPAAGTRVLDLTRVIAGPVCTRYLGALGADVLRIDPPTRPDLPVGRLGDTLVGKRSCILDFSSREGSRRLSDLLGSADVLVCGYRPGALDRHGLSPAQLSLSNPGLVAVYLAAWGHGGPWACRRGFDSVVQSASGIALAESPDSSSPGALPCQALDHGTGYLAAAAALQGLREQMIVGGTRIKRVSLARTAAWLMSRRRAGRLSGPSAARGASVGHDEPSRAKYKVELANGTDLATLIAPVGAIDGTAVRWPNAIARYGEDLPEWSEQRNANQRIG